jgi:hypothetical protein
MMMFHLTPSGPKEEPPYFGDKHLPTVRDEAAKLHLPDRPFLFAVAHHCCGEEGNWRQQSTLFLTFKKATSAPVPMTVTVGDHVLYRGTGLPETLYWVFIDWNKEQGDLSVTIDTTTYRFRGILQSTDMSCILFHPRPVAIEEALTATSNPAA